MGITNLFNKMKVFLKTHIFIDDIFLQRQKFKSDDARLGLRYSYPLDTESVVFDVGGFMGDWAEQISKRYNCYIYVFEPVTSFFDHIKTKFANNSKIKIYNFGLGNKNEIEKINVDGPSSGAFGNEDGVEVQFRDIQSVVKELNINHINLLKLNIEGGEFAVLPRMIECGLISICDDIQVQFHDFIPNSKKLRDDIQSQLKKTHHLTYNYPFTFENWKRND